MERSLFKNSWLSLVTFLAASIAMVLAARVSGAKAAMLASVFAVIGAVAALLGHFQLWLRIGEVREQREVEQLRRDHDGSALFEASPGSLRAKRTREHFERFVIPVLTALLGAGIGLAIWWCLQRLGKPLVIARPNLVFAIFSLVALVSFIVGKYLAGVAELGSHRLLRPGASYLLVVSLSAALTIVAAAADRFGFPKCDLHIARGLLALMAAVCLEISANLILEIYRPRVKGRFVQPVYESRFLGLLAQPGGLFRTAAQTLDYQFGFKVSETWFYRFLENRMAGLALLQILIVWASTSLVIVESHEEGVLERFGKPVMERAILDPGLHFKWPWPIDRARVLGVREVQHLDVGFVPDPTLAGNDTLLWTRQHYQEEYNLLVASHEGTGSRSSEEDQAVPVNLLTVSIPVQYRVTNIIDWSCKHADAGRLLSLLANREVAHYLVSVDLDAFMSNGRRRAAAELRELIQMQANEARLGAEILFVGLQDVHPPVPVADAYEAVIAATQERETKILLANAYRAERLPRARADADRRLQEQKGSSASRQLRAAAQSALFTNQIAAWRASPAVYQTRAYHETLVKAISPARKFVLNATNLQNQFWLNFEEKLRTDLLDVQLPAAKNIDNRK